MTETSAHLPQLSGDVFLTDGGLETDLIFNDGIDLPEFASFVLLKDEAGTEALKTYYRRFTKIASDHGTGFILESPTWRSSPEWGSKLGYDSEALAEANQRAIELMKELRDELNGAADSVVISGCLGPRGDGYVAEAVMTAGESAAFHGPQVQSLVSAGADLVTATTMTNVGEAAGIVLAAEAAGIPSVVSFTVETDGRLPDGTPLLEAIEAVDDLTGNAPAYYMINCAHPDHFVNAIPDGAPSASRVRGILANASRMSHEELDNAEELDDGDPDELASQYAAYRERFPSINIFGGCCGTDVRHVAAIAEACA